MTISTPYGLRVRPVVLGGRVLPLVDRARIYACGVTPYDVTHLGHAATFVWVDALVRVLRHAGVEAEVCRNVTDVDDVLSAAADRAGQHYDRFAAIHQFQFDRDMAALGVRRPQHEPRAHRYVEQVIALAQGLLDLDRAYLAGGGVYFPGRDVADRVGLGEADALALAREYGGRLDDPAKRHPLDTAVWQPSTAGEPAWDSPWGPGRPGWHAECTAMALSTFGPSLDVHAGGADLRFPHHAFEGAMAEALTEVVPFARRWLHAGVVHREGAKMAKSVGNLVLVADLLTEVPAAAVRLAILDRRWADPWEYSAELMAASAAKAESLHAAAARPAGGTAAAEAVSAALRDDLDVPTAVSIALEDGGGAARTVIDVLGLA